MPRASVSEEDVKNPARLRRKLAGAYDQLYDVLRQLQDLERLVTRSQSAGLTDVERNILRALTVGTTENPATGQKPVVPTVTALPPVSSATPGDLVRLSTDGVIYIFVSGAWVSITAASTAHNILSATHGDSLVGTVVRGDIVVGNATPKWAKLAKGAAKTGLRIDSGGNDVEWSGNVAMTDSSNTFTLEQILSALTALTLGGGAATHGAKYQFFFQDEEITLSTVGATTDSAANLLVQSTIVLPVLIRITQTISGGGVTLWRIGDATQNDRFGGDSATLASGSTFWGGLHWYGSVATDAKGPQQTTNAKVRITANATPTAGKIRVVTCCLLGIAPTS